jgi:hypothetical protein
VHHGQGIYKGPSFPPWTPPNMTESSLQSRFQSPICLSPGAVHSTSRVLCMGPFECGCSKVGPELRPNEIGQPV